MDGKGKKLVYASCTVIVETMLDRYQVNDTKQERSRPTLVVAFKNIFAAIELA